MSLPHHASIYTTGRHGCWAVCQCEWKSPTTKTAQGASVLWADHLATATTNRPPETDEENADGR